MVIKRISGWTVSRNFETLLNQINSSKKYSIVSFNPLKMREILNNSVGATSYDRQNRKKFNKLMLKTFMNLPFPLNIKMNSTLFVLWPTDCLESIINIEYKGKNYFYTSLGNTFTYDLTTLGFIKALIDKHTIRKIHFVLSDNN